MKAKYEAADITWLAKTWERIVAEIEYPTKRFVIDVGYHIAEVFLRGRGIRLGSYQSFEKNSMLCADLLTQVVRRVVEDEAKEIWFPSLVKIGLGSAEKALEIVAEVGRGRLGI